MVNLEEVALEEVALEEVALEEDMVEVVVATHKDNNIGEIINA